MTPDWTLRRCARCGVLESDPRAALVVDPRTSEIVHIAGLLHCGVMVAVDDAEVSR